jgi:multiple sugar transport system permease protein
MSRRRAVNLGLDTLTWVVLLVWLAPVLWLLVSSFQDDLELATGAYDLLHPTFKAFTGMWDTIDFERFFVNSLVICTVAALLATAFASSAGYALARFRFRGSRVFGLTVIGTQLIPGSMFLLPLFIGFIWIKQNVGIPLYDTHLGMIIVYTAFFTPVAIFFMRSFFLAIPRDLEEAAMVDGCTPFKAFLKFVANLTQDTAETIPIGIRTFIGNYQQRTAQLMAAGVVSTLPVLIAFFLTQRWLVKGLTQGAVKG